MTDTKTFSASSMTISRKPPKPQASHSNNPKNGDRCRLIEPNSLILWFWPRR